MYFSFQLGIFLLNTAVNIAEVTKQLNSEYKKLLLIRRAVYSFCMEVNLPQA